MGIDILYVSMSDEASFFGDLFLYELGGVLEYYAKHV